jgi:hypothetical protein
MTSADSVSIGARRLCRVVDDDRQNMATGGAIDYLQHRCARRKGEALSLVELRVVSRRLVARFTLEHTISYISSNCASKADSA